MKNIKKILAALLLFAAISATQPAFSMIWIFDKSIANRATAGYDNFLDTWDYLTMPAFFTNLEGPAYELGYSTADKYTADNKMLFMGARVDVGLPLFVNFSTSDNTMRGWVQSPETTVDPNELTTTDFDNIYKVALGFSAWDMGFQVFADLRQNGSDQEFVNKASSPASGDIKKEMRKFRSGDDEVGANLYGLNWGFTRDDDSLVVSAGIAYSTTAGSSYEATFVDGKSVTAKNFGGDAISGFKKVASRTNVDDVGVDFDNDGLNKKDGLRFSSFGWLPVSLLTEEDYLGWEVHYNSPWLLGHEDFSYQFIDIDTANSKNYTSKFETTPSGLGFLELNAYLTTEFEITNSFTFSTALDLTLEVDSYAIKTNPLTTGTTTTTGTWGDDLVSCPTEITDDNISFCNKTTAKTANYYFTVGIPLMSKVDFTDNFTWFSGVYGEVTFNSESTKTDYTGPSVADSATENASSTTYDVLITTGLRYKPLENFSLNVLAQAYSETDLPSEFNFAASASYAFVPPESESAEE